MISRSRGYLPHIVSPKSTYFVTFRLTDSLPTSLLVHWKQEIHNMKTVDHLDLKRRNHEYHSKIENYLDENKGSCWLKDPKIASMVKKALRYFDGTRYHLHAW